MTMPEDRASLVGSHEGAKYTRKAAEFEQLYAEHYSRAYYTAYRLMGNTTEAEDLTQEAFVRVWTAFDSYDRTRPFEGWLHRILSNLAIDRWRRQSNLSICSLDAQGSGGQSRAARCGSGGTGRSSDRQGASLGACLADERPSVMPEQSFLRLETARRVRQALSQMPDYYRTTVVLADVQGYSYEEIAQEIGCGIGTVRSRLHRGRVLLRENVLKLQYQEEHPHVCDPHLPSLHACLSDSPRFARAR